MCTITTMSTNNSTPSNEIRIKEDSLEIIIHPSFPKVIEDNKTKKETTIYGGLESF